MVAAGHVVAGYTVCPSAKKKKTHCLGKDSLLLAFLYTTGFCVAYKTGDFREYAGPIVYRNGNGITSLCRFFFFPFCTRAGERTSGHHESDHIRSCFFHLFDFNSAPMPVRRMLVVQQEFETGLQHAECNAGRVIGPSSRGHGTGH